MHLSENLKMKGSVLEYCRSFVNPYLSASQVPTAE